ncbi:MAG: RNA-directed DNA polymerase [Clostridiales bacterium]|nr:RNA-directed DNA polymerase [Clostridiales bacterium]
MPAQADYDLLCDFQRLYAAHRAARRGKRGNAAVIAFEMNLAENLCKLQAELSKRTYAPKEYSHFTIFEPKKREIFAPRYEDRVVQHCICDNILAPMLEARLIYDNAACRVGKGTHFALNRLSGFLRDFYRKHGSNGYFLKCDIQKFFANIDHRVLKQKLHRVFGSSDLFALLCRIIDSYENIPEVGLPLGNQTSQWFALFYLDGVDRLIKEKLQIRYYSRYMDDFVLLHHDKTHLRHCLAAIRAYCAGELKLELNEKTQILPVKNGVDYLGWHFYVCESGKIIRKLRNEKKRDIQRQMKRLTRDYREGRSDFGATKRSLVSIYGHLTHGHTYRLQNKLTRETVFMTASGASKPNFHCEHRPLRNRLRDIREV